jgi:hypothetical protein
MDPLDYWPFRTPYPNAIVVYYSPITKRRAFEEKVIRFDAYSQEG